MGTGADHLGLTFREKRKRIGLLRSLLIIAVGGLFVISGSDSGGLPALILILAFALSQGGLLLVRPRTFSSKWFDLSIGAADLVLVGIGVSLAGSPSGALPISGLLMILVVALGNYRAHTVAGAAIVGAIHSWLVLGRGAGVEVASQLALQVLFLSAVAMYYGFLVRGVHLARRSLQSEEMQHRELSTLLQVLDASTSSLDLHSVTLAIVERITQVIPAVRCSILFIDESERCFVMASHDDPSVNMLEIDLKKYPEVRKAVETGDSVHISDVSKDPLMAEVRSILEDRDFNSLMVVPLTFGNDILGTLCLKTARIAQEFTQREMGFCTAVARASANAVKNALLHSQLGQESGRHRRTGEKLARILDHSPDLILTTDNDGQITEFNCGGETLLGYQREMLIGQPCRRLFAGDELAGLVQRILAETTVSNRQVSLRRLDDSEVVCELNASVLKDENGQVEGTVWLGRDVTELKAVQTQLLRAKKLSTIGEVISGVAHELNNPLSGVLGYSQLMLSRNPESSVARDLGKINEAAVRCQKIVKNLLAFARSQPPEQKYLGANGILEKTIDLRQYQLHLSSIEVVRDLKPDLPMTMLDFHQMQQVFLNLLANAQHAMDSMPDRPSRLEVRTRLREGRIHIEISDNGVGMDLETQERAFDPFFSTKEVGKGTGLGLSVSYGIIQEHGGQIYCRSRKGEGSTFVIELPVRQPEQGTAAAERGRASGGSTASTPARILAVDDEPMILDLMIDVLEALGHKVDTASNGREACEKVRRSSYELIISDVRMPHMNGIEMYRNILAIRPEMRDRMIFVTGDLVDEATVDFLAETNVPSMPKPLEIGRVARMVENVLNTEESPVTG